MIYIYLTIILILVIYIIYRLNNNLLHVNSEYGTIVLYNDLYVSDKICYLKR